MHVSFINFKAYSYWRVKDKHEVCFDRDSLKWHFQTWVGGVGWLDPE